MKRTSQIKIKEIRKQVQDFREKSKQPLNDFIKENIHYIIKFSSKEWEEEFKRIYGQDANKNDFISLGMGGIIRKDKLQEYKQVLKADDLATRTWLLADKKNAFNMFFYEMNNHEYIYDNDDEAVLNACDIDQEFLKENDLQDTYNKARKYYWNIAVSYC